LIGSVFERFHEATTKELLNLTWTTGQEDPEE